MFDFYLGRYRELAPPQFNSELLRYHLENYRMNTELKSLDRSIPKS